MIEELMSTIASFFFDLNVFKRHGENLGENRCWGIIPLSKSLEEKN